MRRFKRCDGSYGSRAASCCSRSRSCWPASSFRPPTGWGEWSMWNRRDPSMAMTFFGPESGAGAGWSWDSKTEGKGRMTFLTADPARGFTYELYFPDFDSTSTGEIRFEPQGNATRLTWTNAGNVGRNPLMHYLAPLMDHMVGPDFEAGLANLKVMAERP